MKVHETYMQRALDNALKGLGHVQPNPLVGCVIVHEDKIIGEGYHQVYGGPHAEVVAVHSVKEKEKLAESTLYVTLEPCVHYGKTPPCADLILENKIKTVVIASIDPFAEVNGKGIDKLRRSGVEVITGILQKEADWMNRRFFKFHKEKKPYIILKWAQSEDGFIDPVRVENQKGSIVISSEFSRTLSHRWRTEEQAILVGKNTALADNPSLTPRLFKGKQPLRILVDPHLEVGKENNLLSDGNKTLVLNSQRSGSEKSILYHKINFDNFFQCFNDALYEMNIQSVIIEGGRFTLQEFINSANWDEARVFTSGDKLLGGITAPELGGEPSEELDSGSDRLRIYYNEKI